MHPGRILLSTWHSRMPSLRASRNTLSVLQGTTTPVMSSTHSAAARRRLWVCCALASEPPPELGVRKPRRPGWPPEEGEDWPRGGVAFSGVILGFWFSFCRQRAGSAAPIINSWCMAWEGQEWQLLVQDSCDIILGSCLSGS